MALEAGASKDEIVGAAAIAAAAAGPKGFVNCFETILEEIKKKDKT
jgi:alkylhydroperoxidase/carboxymuconolactone decarboxylase family protein YurZ